MNDDECEYLAHGETLSYFTTYCYGALDLRRRRGKPTTNLR